MGASYVADKRYSSTGSRIIKTVVRPTAEVLTGLVGADARATWDRLAEGGEMERLNAVLRFLFAAVIIDEHRAPQGTFDYSRIEIEPNPL